MMIERLSFEDYQNVKNYAVSILNEYKTRGIEKLETDQVAQIVGDIDSLSNPAKTLLYATLLFPSDEEFINVSNELKDNDKIAEHFGRKVSDVIGKQYQIDICARLSMIDFYLERAYLLKYISQKQLFTYISKLEELIRMTKGWIKVSE